MVSIVSVNYRTKQYLVRMLETLFAHVKVPIEVIVVENGSGEDLSDLVANHPQMRLVRSERNLGFAGGNNLGLLEAKGDFFLLVNPDIEFTEDAVAKIEDHMRRDADVAVGGISLKNQDGSQQPCVWRFPRPADQLLMLTKLPHLFPNLPPINRWLAKDFDYSKTQDVDQVMGAFFCIRREAYEKLGGLDDGFFMWYEEVDFCKRAKDAGWKVRYYADVAATHARGRSFLTLRTWSKQKMVLSSLRRYARKHWGWRFV